MANPRRTTLQLQTHQSSPSSFLPIFLDHQQQPPSFLSQISSAAAFLKRPLAFPVLLSLLLLLTWLSLRLRQPLQSNISSSLVFQGEKRNWGVIDGDVNLVRFGIEELPSRILKDPRGWIFDPIALSMEVGLVGPQSCASVHVGEIRPRGVRGNHRHHKCNETFVIWGADTKFRLEIKRAGAKWYSEAFVAGDEVGIAASPAGSAHALVNVDISKSTFFLGCQDSLVNYNGSTTDYNVWEDL